MIVPEAIYKYQRFLGSFAQGLPLLYSSGGSSLLVSIDRDRSVAEYFAKHMKVNLLYKNF